MSVISNQSLLINLLWSSSRRYIHPLSHRYIQILITEILHVLIHIIKSSYFNSIKIIIHSHSIKVKHKIPKVGNLSDIYVRSIRSGQPNQCLFLNTQVNSNPTESTDRFKSNFILLMKNSYLFNHRCTNQSRS